VHGDGNAGACLLAPREERARLSTNAAIRSQLRLSADELLGAGPLHSVSKNSLRARLEASARSAFRAKRNLIQNEGLMRRSELRAKLSGGTALLLEPTRARARAAVLVFAVAVFVALVVFLAIGRYRWFTHDEWDYLAGRDGGDIENLLIPHNEHWSTLPILTFRILFRVVGLQSYLPYRAVLVLLHLVAATLLRVVMRRAGVGPWIATASALLLVFFGTGSEIIVYAVNVGFVGALVLGLTQLLLADHDGPIGRRDWLGLLAGFASLLCSSVALTTVGVVGLATLVRRGWRAAALQTVPLALVYAVWFRAFEDERTAQGVGYTHTDVSSPQEVRRFVTTGVRAAFDGMGQVYGVGWALGILLVVGLVLAWRSYDWAERRRRLATPIALLVGGFATFFITGIARAAAFGPGFARTGRYLYLFTALALPALAVAAEAVARRWRVLAPVALVLLLVGIPGNIDALLQRRRVERSTQSEYRRLVLTVPRLPVAHQVPRSVRPEQRLAKPLTLGWLLDGVASGRIPKPAHITPIDAATATLHLALNQQPDVFRAKSCRNATTPLELDLAATEAIGIHDAVRVVYITPTGVRSRPVTFEADERVVTQGGRALLGPRLVALVGPLRLEVTSVDPNTPASLCV
jgi:hypothetical protein